MRLPISPSYPILHHFRDRPIYTLTLLVFVLMIPLFHPNLEGAERLTEQKTNGFMRVLVLRYLLMACIRNYSILRI